ncbi:unnamed protein product [Amoebophrya sp. A25]|nr:unnamed protein product [Amoebophrya sp. A25]|eukprot:GSA25T00010983001.1
MLEGTSTAPSSSEQQQVVKELVREQQQTDQNQDEDLAPAPAPVFTTSTTPTPSSSSSSPSSSARPRPRRRLVVQTSSGGRELMSAKRRAVFAREVIDVVQDYAHTRAGVDLTTKKRKERLGGSSSASPTSSSSHIDGTEPEPPGGSPRTGGVAVASQTTPSSSSSGQKKGDSKRAVQPPRLALGNHIFFCFSNNGTFLLLTMRELNLVNPCAVVLDCAPGELTWRNIGRVFSHALPPRLASFFRPESSIVSPGSAKSIRESGISARGESALQDEQQHGDHDKKEELLETRSSTTKQPVVDTSNRKFLKQVARLCGPDCRMYFFYSKGDTLCEAWFIRECIRRRAAHVEQEGTTSRSNSSKGPIHLKHRTFEYVFGRSEHCANLLVYPREYKSLVAHVLAWESAADIADAEDQAEDLACPQPAMWAYNTNANNPEIGSGARTKEQRSRL